MKITYMVAFMGLCMSASIQAADWKIGTIETRENGAYVQIQLLKEPAPSYVCKSGSHAFKAGAAKPPANEGCWFRNGNVIIIRWRAEDGVSRMPLQQWLVDDVQFQ